MSSSESLSQVALQIDPAARLSGDWAAREHLSSAGFPTSFIRLSTKLTHTSWSNGLFFFIFIFFDTVVTGWAVLWGRGFVGQPLVVRQLKADSAGRPTSLSPHPFPFCFSVQGPRDSQRKDPHHSRHNKPPTCSLSQGVHRMPKVRVSG